MEILAKVSHVLNKTFSFGDDALSEKLVRRLGLQGNGALNMPNGIAVTAKGDVIVADSGHHRLVIFGADHQLKKVISNRGHLPHQLHFPICVALAPCQDEEEILVTDSVNASVKAFRQNGDFIRQVENGAAFDFPHGLAVSKNSCIAITDLIRHSVILMNQNGDIRCEFGCYGSKPRQLDHPNHVAISNDDHVIVCDTGNAAVKFFSFSGELLKMFDMRHFRLLDDDGVIIQGVAIDNHGSILVVGNNTLYILSSNGRLWEVVIPEEGLYAPKCIAHNPTGSLVLTQCGLDNRGEVTEFRYDSGDYCCLHSPTKPLNISKY